MKVVVMIPAFNEEKSIGKVIKEIPRKIEGVDKVEVLVIDDGSTDNTVKVAKDAGADKVVSHKHNLGLGVAFRTGLEIALSMGADIVVNIDADGQYYGGEIPMLILPILENKADVVLTDRRVLSLTHMPFGKKYGNLIATFVTRIVSGFNVKDAQSGFRAFSREAALKLNLLADYTYVQETIIQAVDKKLRIVQIPCIFRAREGKSRLISSIWNYAKRAGSVILRTYVRYKPLKVFTVIGITLFILGSLLSFRFLYFYFQGEGGGHIQSLILASILLLLGFQIIILGLIADTIDATRRIDEEILYQIRKEKLGRK